MVEAEPAFLHLVGQARQSLINCGPVTEMLQSLGLAIQQRLFQPEPSFVVHIVIEVYIDSGGRIVQQEPSHLGNHETVGLCVHQNRTDAKRCLGQAFHCIVGESRLLHNLLTRQTIVRIAQQVEDTELQHQSGSLEHNGAPCYKLSHTLGIPSAYLFLSVFFF